MDLVYLVSLLVLLIAGLMVFICVQTIKGIDDYNNGYKDACEMLREWAYLERQKMKMYDEKYQIYLDIYEITTEEIRKINEVKHGGKKNE